MSATLAELAQHCRAEWRGNPELQIDDDVTITGAAVVTHSIRIASDSPLELYTSWLKNAVCLRQLDDMARRLKKLEQKFISFSEGGKVE